MRLGISSIGKGSRSCGAGLTNSKSALGGFDQDQKERARFEGLRRQEGAGGIPFPTLASKTSFRDVACKKQYKAATTSRFGMITIFLLRNATDLYITAHVGLQGNK